MMRDWGVCRDCALKENCAEYKPYKRQCEDYERYEEVLTHEELLRQCNTEQLAEWITDIVYACREQDGCIDCRLGWCSKDSVVEWLKQPHTKE